ncbi:MAG TPA: MMPL family transporter, partial [Dehalococcoidales bacterium]|nr:MMPL family transporter [Dehalococcoidales bacterium]
QIGKATTMDEMIIVRSDALTVDDPAFMQQVNALTTDVNNLGPATAVQVVNYYMYPMPQLVSPDKHSTIISFQVPVDNYKNMKDVYAVTDKYTASGFQVYNTGSAAFMADQMEMGENQMAIGEKVGIGVALIVLALVFGALTAALVPVLMGIAGIVVALGLTALVGHSGMDLTFMVTNMITMMGLAVGIDYSLFVLTRFREERTKGLEKMDAIGKAGSTASRAIFYSGLTVMFALTGLVLFPLSIFVSMGIGSLLVVFASIIASLTLLPALLGIFGDKVNSLRIPFVTPKVAKLDNPNKGFWAWITRTVTKVPAVSIVIVVAILVTAIVPFFSKVSGMSGISAIPDNLRSKQGYTVLVRDFHVGLDSPTEVVIDGDVTTPTAQNGIAALQAKIAADPIFSSTTVTPYPQAKLAVIDARVNGDTMSPEAKAAVTRIRTEYIPATLAGVNVKAMVTGESAFMVDYDTITNNYTPWIFLFVLSLSFVVLLLAFRSIVVPVTAIIMNLLSVGASYGLIVLVFQKGFLAKFLGFTQVPSIETWLPLFLFAVLFGLSMDYQVFLLSRIREKYNQVHDNTTAVAFGLRNTGKLITGAALIMVAVFGGFALGDMVMMQQMGFGLAIAIFIDATLVRCVLVPATMKLLGKRNWYLPAWLNWIPKIGLGENEDATSAPTATGVVNPHGKAVPQAVPVIAEDGINPRKTYQKNSDTKNGG